MNPENNDREILQMWQTTTFSDPLDAARLARAIERRTQRFDRIVFWRNFREYAAGALLGAWFIWQAIRFPGHRLTAITGLAVIFVVLFYLWRSHRRRIELDETANLQSFHASLLARYDHQIGLLRRVKYWYVLPMYLWMLFVLFTTQGRNVRARILAFVLITGFSAFVVWLNQSYGVRRLEREKQKARELLDRG